MIQLSIIIPIYNVEHYIQECLESLLPLKNNSVEFILVNDGSTDTSINIVQTYLKKDSRFKLINQKNQGLGAARNTGIYHAKGIYISFLDSDDYINSNVLDKMLSLAIKNNTDLIIANYQIVSDNKCVSFTSTHPQNIDNNFYLQAVLSNQIPMMVCNKIYKKELFIQNNIKFPTGVLYEDLIVTTQIAYYINSIKIFHENLYFWRQRENSLSRGITHKNIKDRIYALSLIQKFLIASNCYTIYKTLFMRLYSVHMLEHLGNAIQLHSKDLSLLSILISKIQKHNILDLNLMESKYKKLYNSYKNTLIQGKIMEQKSRETIYPETQSEINYDFNRKINSLYAQIGFFKESNLKYIIYGNGIVGNIIKNLLADQVMIIVDQNNEEHNNNICAPQELKQYKFDKIIISVLGREEEIKNNLIHIYKIPKDKIISININENILFDYPIFEAEQKKLQTLHNKFHGKRCFIVGNGPSLNKCDLTLLKDEYTFGVNGIFYKTDEMGFKPTFYMVEDRAVMHDNTQRINEFDCQYKFFPSIYKEQIELTDNTYFFRADMGFYHKYHPSFCIPRFSKDFSEKAFTGQSVTIMLIQLAYYLGFTDVYLIGMDFSYSVPESTKIEGDVYESNEDDPNHFHPEYFGKGKKWHDPKLERVALNYEKAKEVFEEEGRNLKNATVGGQLEIFERVDYNSLFK